MRAFSAAMKVIGLSEELSGAAERQCGEKFRAWMVETQNATWGSWEELVKHYPNASQTADEEAHFPLKTDGTGVRARIFFHTRLIILRCIAPAPVTTRIAQRHQSSPSPRPTQTHENTTQPI